MNILCIVAHPDDELLGCGATLRKLRDAGHHVFSCVLCAAADARHARPDLDRLRAISAESERIVGIEDSMKFEFLNIQFNTVPHLTMVNAMEQAILKFKPDWVFTHHPGDLNIDHRVCHESAMAAVTLPQRLSHDLPPAMIQRVYLIEILSSTDWALPLAPAFRPNAFFDVRQTLDVKLAALDAFEGALKPPPHPRTRDNVCHLARLRGGQVGLELAEAFELVRDVIL